MRADRRFASTLLASVYLACVCAAGPGASRDTIAEALAKQQSTIAVTDGALTGDGAATLRQASEGAQFVFVGEDHGIREIAAFCTAYFVDLSRFGFRTLAIEDGPFITAELGALVHQPDALQAMTRFVRSYPMAVAFYDLKEEAEGLKLMAQVAGADFMLWGFDQELMGAPRYLLQEMARYPLSDEAKKMINDLFAKDAEAFLDAVEKARPELMFMMTAEIEELQALRAELVGPKDRRVLRLLDALLESRSIYAKHFAGEMRESNLQRARLMKRNLAAKLGEAPTRKVLIKAGAFHAYAGVNPLGNRDLGNFVAEYADGRNVRSLHVLVLALRGEQARFTGIGQPMQAAAIAPIDAASPLSGVRPLIESAKEREGWTLFDLRPLRADARALSRGDAELERLIHGFEFVVLIPQGTASQDL